MTGARVADVETCAPELDGIDCVVSDENGSWKMPGLPLDSDIVLTSTHADSVPALFPQTTTMDWYDWYKTPIPNWIMENHASRLGVELDQRGGGGQDLAAGRGLPDEGAVVIEADEASVVGGDEVGAGV